MDSATILEEEEQEQQKWEYSCYHEFLDIAHYINRDKIIYQLR